MTQNKKTFLAFLFFLTILAIGAVSASADNGTDIALTSDDTSDVEIGADNTQNNATQEDDVTTEDEPSTPPATSENDGDNQQENDDQISFNPDDLNVDFPKTGLIGHGDDRDCILINMSLPKDSNGNMSIYEENNLLTSFELNQSHYARYNVFVLYSSKDTVDSYVAYIYPSKAGDVKYTIKYDVGTESFEKSANVNISYVLGCFNQSYYGNTALRIMLPWSATGSFNVLIDGKKYSTYTKNVDGEKSYYVKLSPLLSIGKHKVTITYMGDEKYPKSTVEETVNVYGKIKMPSTNRLTNNEVISLKLPKKAKGSLVVKVYNYKGKVVKTFTKKLVDGKASISFSKEKFFGTYSEIVARYTGSDYKVSEEMMDEVSINPPIVLTKEMLKGEKKYLSINLPGKKGVLKLYYEVKLKDGTVKTKVISKKLVKGKAKIVIPKLAVGIHDLKVKFIQTLKSGKKVSYVYYRQLEVVKPLKISSAKKLHYGTAKVKIQAYKSGGKVLANKYIKVKINNKYVKKVKTNSKGVASFKIPKKYKPNTYKITAIYNKYTVSKKIRIYKATA